ncbi:MAG TPA: hypothetical protein VGZ02_11130 [Candidatus Baltobacteraceae bacterium]|jgi:hypothetical protein|nr:hypothetical protein [Candidatus Baltobacteraceae bacterium]
MRVFLALLAAALCGLLAACGNAGSTPPSQAILGQPSPTPTPFNGHLYVEYANPSVGVGAASADGFAVYSLPLTAQSTPLFAVAQPVGPMAFDPSGNLFAITQSNVISEFRFPFTANSTPSAVITSGAQTIPSFVTDIAFDTNGNLWAETASDLRDFVPPITAASTAQTIVSGGLNQLTIDPSSGKAYAGNTALHFGATDTILVYNFYPYTAPPKSIGNAQFSAPLGFYPDGTILISSTGANVIQQIPGSIAPPGLEVVNSLSSSLMVPYIIPFTVTNQASLAHSAAIDQNGTTYILDGHLSNALDVFAFPMTQNSRPQFRIGCVPAAGMCQTPVGVYLGP